MGDIFCRFPFCGVLLGVCSDFFFVVGSGEERRPCCHGYHMHVHLGIDGVFFFFAVEILILACRRWFCLPFIFYLEYNKKILMITKKRVEN